MDFLAALTVLIASQTISTPSKTLFCEQRLGDGRDKFSGLAQLETDKEHRTLSSVLRIYGPGYEAEWNAAIQVQNVSLSPASVEIEAWPLPKNTSFPISVEVTFDGASAGKYIFKYANVRIVNTATGVPPFSHFSAVTLPKPLNIHLPWQFEKIGLVTTDSRGVVIDRRTLDAPDWQAFSTFANTSFPDLERQRLRKKCHHYYTNLVID